jgi:hypothetical protein
LRRCSAVRPRSSSWRIRRFEEVYFVAPSGADHQGDHVDVWLRCHCRECLLRGASQRIPKLGADPRRSTVWLLFPSHRLFSW